MLIHVGLATWILADGNYDDFSLGQERKFALEFHPRQELLPAAEAGPRTLEHREGCLYSARGEVVHLSHREVAMPHGIWVCDFGLQAYCDGPTPDWAHVGAGVAGDIYLGVDHFSYFERYHKLPGVPRLTHRVRIRRILLEQNPMIADPEGRYAAIPDVSRVEVREVESTAVFRVDPDETLTVLRRAGVIVPETQSHFVLECEILESGVDPAVDRG